MHTPTGETTSPRLSLAQARLSPDEAKHAEETMRILGIVNRSDLIRSALERLYQEAREIDAARQIEEYYKGETPPLDPVTAAMYGPEG